MRQYCLFVLLTTFFRLNSHAQFIQTTDEIENNRHYEIKTIRIITKQYPLLAGQPELTDTSIQFFDTSGRIIKEQFQSGTHFLRKFSYNHKSQLMLEEWWVSSLDVYPGSIKPVKEEEYDKVFLVKYYNYDTANQLSGTIEKGPIKKKTTYQYNDSGVLIATIEVEQEGQVSGFIINKYGIGLNRNKMEQSVSSVNGTVQIKNFDYDSKNKLTRTTTTYDDGKMRVTHYDDREKMLYEQVYNKKNQLTARFDFSYDRFGISKIVTYRNPSYNSKSDTPANTLQLSEEEVYEYETY